MRGFRYRSDDFDYILTSIEDTLSVYSFFGKLDQNELLRKIIVRKQYCNDFVVRNDSYSNGCFD
jgi:hypothetical protein